MRQRQTNQGISVNAIARIEVVLIRFNATSEAAKGLLGFAIYRLDHQAKSKLIRPPDGLTRSGRFFGLRPGSNHFFVRKITKNSPSREC